MIERDTKQTQDATSQAESRHVTKIGPWWCRTGYKKNDARRREQQRKGKKARRRRDDRIERDLPVPPSLTETEIARQVLSAKFKGRNRRTVLEQVIGSGGLHAWREKAITSHGAQTVPTDYDWSWRQKQFRPEERMADRIDRIVARMVGISSAQIKELGRPEFEVFGCQQQPASSDRQSRRLCGRKRQQVGDGSNDRSLKLLISKKQGGRMANKALVSDKKTRDKEPALRPRSSAVEGSGYGHHLAEDIALFLDADDTPVNVLESLVGYLNHSFDAGRIAEVVHHKFGGYLDLAAGHRDEHESGDTKTHRSAAFRGESNFEVSYGDDMADALSFELIEGLLGEQVDEVIIRAKVGLRSECGSEAATDEFYVLRAHVINEIMKDWVTLLWIEEDSAYEVPLSITTMPFREAFGPDFANILLAAVLLDHPYLPETPNENISPEDRGPHHAYPGVDRLGCRSSQDVARKTHVCNDNKECNTNQVHDKSTKLVESIDDESSKPGGDYNELGSANDRSGDGLSTTEKQSLDWVIKYMVNRETPPAVDEDDLRAAWGPDWRVRFLLSFQRAVGIPDQIRLQAQNTMAADYISSKFPFRPDGWLRARNQPERIYVPHPPNLSQINPKFWPRVVPDQDCIHVKKVNDQLAKDTFDIEAEADRHERDFSWDMHNRRARDNLLLPELMAFHNFHDFNHHHSYALDQYTDDPEGQVPVGISLSDSFVMSRTWPFEYDSDAWNYPTEQADLDVREDACL